MAFALGLAVLATLVGLGCAEDSPAAARPVTTESPVLNMQSATSTVNPTTIPPTAFPSTAVPSLVPRVEDTPPPTPFPSNTPILSPDPTSTREPVASSAIPGARIALGRTAFEYTRQLAEDLGPRASASKQELAAAEYLVDRFEELGYEPGLQEFEVEALDSIMSFSVAGDPSWREVQSHPLTHSVAGKVSGPLEFVGLGGDADTPPNGLDGKVALIERGEITFRDKVANAAEAGAVGAVIFNNRPGRFRGTLGEPSQIPALSVSQESGATFREAMSRGLVNATVTLEESASQSRNVVAEKPGTGEGVVVLGAHYDTVPDSPGANDNASGTAVVLAVAREVSDRSYPFTIRFIAFGSEETGLRGSRHYVNSLTTEKQREIQAMINVDVVGTGNGLRVSGERWLTGHVSGSAAREGIDLGVRAGIRGGSSDHASFRRAGVPVIFFSADDLSRIHSPDDTLEFVDPKLLGDTALLVLDLLESLDKLSAESG